MQESTHFHNLGGTRSTIAVPACMEWGSYSASAAAAAAAWSEGRRTTRLQRCRAPGRPLPYETTGRNDLAVTFWKTKRGSSRSWPDMLDEWKPLHYHSINQAFRVPAGWRGKGHRTHVRNKHRIELVNESFGPTQIWSYIFKCWPNIGQNLSRCWQMFDQVWQGCQSRLRSVTKFGNCYFFLKPARGL